MKFEVTCNVCRRAVKVKDAYLNIVGVIELRLSCGHHLFLKVERLKQDGETGP